GTKEVEIVLPFVADAEDGQVNQAIAEGEQTRGQRGIKYDAWRPSNQSEEAFLGLSDRCDRLLAEPAPETSAVEVAHHDERNPGGVQLPRRGEPPLQPGETAHHLGIHPGNDSSNPLARDPPGPLSERSGRVVYSGRFGNTVRLVEPCRVCHGCG